MAATQLDCPIRDRRHRKRREPSQSRRREVRWVPRRNTIQQCLNAVNEENGQADQAEDRGGRARGLNREQRGAIRHQRAPRAGNQERDDVPGAPKVPRKPEKRSPRDPGEGRGRRVRELLKGNTRMTSGPTSVSTRLQRIAELAREMRGAALTTLSHHIDFGFSARRIDEPARRERQASTR
jgi:hypothetical protein